MKKHQGLIIIYTGDGRGKTTAAMGLAMRAIAIGRKVTIFQFIKQNNSSEKQFLEKYPDLVKFYQNGLGFVGLGKDKYPKSDHQESAQKLLNLASSKMRSIKNQLIIFDEINVAISLKLINISQVINLLKLKDNLSDVVLTGRGAPKKLIEMADLVTKMKNIKHPFDRGILAKKGLDY